MGTGMGTSVASILPNPRRCQELCLGTGARKSIPDVAGLPGGRLSVPGDPRGCSAPFGGPGESRHSRPAPAGAVFPAGALSRSATAMPAASAGGSGSGGTVGTRTGSGGGGAMAGLSVRDPAVDRSLRSVFGEAAGRDRDLQRERGRDGQGGGGRRVFPPRRRGRYPPR